MDGKTRRINLPTPATPQEVQAFIVRIGGIIEYKPLCPPSQFAGDDEPEPLITEAIEQWWDSEDEPQWGEYRGRWEAKAYLGGW